MFKFKNWKDPISALTHFIALLIVIPCSILLIYYSSKSNSPIEIISFVIFGLSLILLYSASTIYHMLEVSKEASNMLRKIDHMMIFILIAGTYTPVCLISLKGIWGNILLILVWSMAFAGILLKIFWINAPRWLSTAIYVIMGWVVVIAFYPLIKAIPLRGVLLLTLGGITYTVGAVIYALKRPKLNFKLFGFHEIFHLFVMGGSFFHILFMFKFVV